ncbi:hypothetical protein MTIM_32440 [Mycobacterium timonense]|uniref:Uncharacterized protein n=1 Tax=Mycobacterium timonense TaxID=701043 RepID=A0A7I9Z938_9MYCO|nr:hypothetical protein MTIM_32440 [Mycobacterium timonense]
MDIHEALYTTRMMRRLRPDPAPLDTQARILDAAIRALPQPLWPPHDTTTAVGF